MKRFFNIVTFLVLFLCLAACTQPTEMAHLQEKEGEKIVFDKFSPVNEQSWAKSDTLFIYIPVQEKPLDAELLFTVRSSNAYAYRNLQLRAALQEIPNPVHYTRIHNTRRHLFVEDTTVHANSRHWRLKSKKVYKETFPLAKSDTIQEIVQMARPVRTDRINFNIFDERDRTAGKGILHYETHTKPYHIHLSGCKTYRLAITHGMRERYLKGISDIGVRLTTANNKNLAK